MSRLACPYRMDVTGPKGGNGLRGLVLSQTATHRGLVRLFNAFSNLLPRRVSWLWLVAICCLIAAAVFAFLYGKLVLDNAVGRLQSIDPASSMSTLLIIALIMYALLLAVPFMPGIEVGVALLLLKGAAIAPYVYVATVAGLMLAFVIGRCVPLEQLAAGFRRLRWQRVADLLHSMQQTAPVDRLNTYRSLLPRWLSWIAVDYRYVSLGLLLNVPGTFALGGGGGILIAAGFSRLFHGGLVLLTLMIATLPVPLTVWIMGTKVLSAFQ